MGTALKLYWNAVARWSLVGGLAAAACLIAACGRHGVETDLYALVDMRQGGVLRELASGMAGRGRILLEGQDFGTLRSRAEDIRRRFSQETTSLEDTLKFLAKHHHGLLSPETRSQLLKGCYGEVSSAAMARLYGLTPALVSAKEDPFLLATDFLLSLQDSRPAGWTLREGELERETDGKVQILLDADLSKVPAKEVANFLVDEEKGDPLVRTWCGGAPFHAARATASAVHEINVLSAVSLLLVVILGRMLFRSFRFVMPLVATLVAAFVAATAVLFVAFPRPHVLTFVFGTSLIGLAVDYVYHSRMSRDIKTVLRPLTLSLLTTEACLSPLLFSVTPVLRQMALFTGTGLLAAFAWSLAWGQTLPSSRGQTPSTRGQTLTPTPNPMGTDPNSHRGQTPSTKGQTLTPTPNPMGTDLNSHPQPVGTDPKLVGTDPKRRPVKCFYGLKKVVFVLLAAVGLFRLRISSDPASFYTPDRYLAESEKRLATCLPSKSGRFVFVRGQTLQEAMEREEDAGLRGITTFIPSIRRQRENASLKARLYEAEGKTYGEKTGLKVEMPPKEVDWLTPKDIKDLVLARMAKTMLVPGGIVAPCPDGFRSNDPDIIVLEPKRALEELFAGFSSATLHLLGFSALVLAVLLAVIFRKKAISYVLSLCATFAATAGVLGWLGTPVTFFTLLCFFAVAGLGLDYAIFSRNRANPDTERTVFFSFLTSFVGLGMLSFTGFAVTRAMGTAFAVGLFFAWLCAGRQTKVIKETRAWHEQGEQSAGRLRMMFMWYSYAWAGKTFLKLLCIPVTIFIYPFADAAKSAIRKFYAVLGNYKGSSRVKAPVFRHLLGFAWSLADKTDACTLRKNLPAMSVRDDREWKSFNALVEAGKGAFLFSTHLGTIEVLPALGGTDAPHVHAFRQMGHDAIFTRMFARHLDTSRLTIHPVEEIGVETAVRMQEAISHGELVLMAGDRVSAGSSRVLNHTFLGRKCEWPKGTFVFAKLMESPVFFVTCVRTGWNSYEVHVREYSPDGKPNVDEMLDQYVRFLEEETLAFPGQWYQFYDFFADEDDSGNYKIR